MNIQILIIPFSEISELSCISYVTPLSLKMHVIKGNGIKYEIQLNSDISEDDLIKTETCKVLNNQHMNNIKLRIERENSMLDRDLNPSH